MIKVKTIKYKENWQNDERVVLIRKIIEKRLKRIRDWIDIQDIEHQVLFRLTSFRDWKSKINPVFNEQLYIIRERMKKAKVKPKQLFCFGKKRKDEWLVKWGKNRNLFCLNKKKKREIVFREITLEYEKEIARSIINDYHYIHFSRSNREKGMIFGFFLKGRKLPFAVEEVEPVDIGRNYKKAILMLSDIDYHTTCELTRFYSVPNTPKNLISVLDKLVGRELKYRGFEWMMTTTMPAFAKSKASTVAGGINAPLLAKKLKFSFFERDDKRYELCVERKKEKLKGRKIIKSVWKMSPVLEMIKPLKQELYFNNKFYCYVDRN